MSSAAKRAFNRWFEGMTPEERREKAEEGNKLRRQVRGPRPGQVVIQPSGREYFVDPNGCYRRKK